MSTQNFGRNQTVQLMRRIHAGEPFDVSLMPRCDVQLRGLAFAENGADLQLQLRASVGGMTLDWVLLALQVHALKIDLDYGDRGARMPMTWDMLIDQDRRQEEWFVIFDFASHGELRFRCSNLEIDRHAARLAEAVPEPSAPSVQFVIVLDSDELDNPDTDLAVLLPEAIETRTDGMVVGEGWAYDDDERMHLYFRSADQQRGLAAIQSALDEAPVCGNQLGQAMVGSRASDSEPFRILSPPSRVGTEFSAID